MEHKYITQTPHCDARILHAPGECSFCDDRGEWQELRQMWGIAFTGRSYVAGKLVYDEDNHRTIQPCPAELDRGMDSLQSWGGNLPANKNCKSQYHHPDARYCVECLPYRSSPEGLMVEATQVLKKKKLQTLTCPLCGREVGEVPFYCTHCAIQVPKTNVVEHSESKKVTLSGKPADPDYEKLGSAPQPLGENGQHKDYWVLSAEERAKGLVRPVRKTYRHITCKHLTTMDIVIAETYARDPKFYGSTFCTECGAHYPVEQFVWLDGSKVGD